MALSRNVDGEIIVGIDIQGSTPIIQKDVQDILSSLKSLEVSINEANLTDNAKNELRTAIEKVTNLTANVDKLELDESAKTSLREAIGKVSNLTANIDNVQLDTNFQANLQTALNKLQGLTVNIGQVNVNKNAVQAVTNTLNQTPVNLNVGVTANNTSTQQAQKVGQQMGKIISDSAENAIRDVTSKVIGEGFTVPPRMSQQVETELSAMVEKWTNGKGKVSSIVVETTTGFDETELKNIEQLKAATIQYSNALGEVVTKRLRYDRQIGLSQSANGETEVIRGWVEASSTYKKSLDDMDKSTTSFVNRQKKSVADLSNQVKQIYQSAIDPNASKPIKDSGNLNELETKYKDIVSAINRMGDASETTFVDERNNVSTLISDLKILVRQYKNAETAATTMRSKDITTIKAVKGNELDEFIAKIKNSKVPISQMQTEIDDLQASLNSIGDTDSLTKFLNQFDVTNSKFKALKEQFKQPSSKQTQQDKKYALIQQNERERLAIQKRMVGASDTERSTLQKQYNKRTKRIADAEKYLVKHNLEDNDQKREKSNITAAGSEKVNTAISKEIDKILSGLAKVEQSWDKQGISVETLTDKSRELKELLGGINLTSTLDLDDKIKTLDQAKSILSALQNATTGKIDSQKNSSSVFKQMSDTYKEILTINNKIANLNPDKNKSEIAELESKKAKQEEILKICQETYDVMLKECSTMEEQNALAQKKSQAMTDAYNTVVQEKRTQAEQAKNKQNDADEQAITKQIANINDNLTKGNYSTQIKQQEAALQRYGYTADQVEKEVKELTEALKVMSSTTATNEEKIAAEKKYQTALAQTKNVVREAGLEWRNLATEQQRLSLANSIEAFMQKNTRITKEAKNELNNYIAELRDLDTAMTKVRKNDISVVFKQTENSMRALHKLGYALTDQFKQAAGSFTQWLSVSSLIMTGITKSRQAITELIEVDSILTEISKTSDMTERELAELGSTSFDTASKMGRTATDYLNTVTEMSRSGFYGEQGEAMAQQALLAQTAGDLTADMANQYVLATNAAYKLNGEAEKLNAIIDGQNSITNQNSVAMADMAEAMSIAGSVAASYRVKDNEFSAIVGTIEAVTKLGGSEVGNGIKSLLINLQNVGSAKIVGTLDKAGASMTKMVNGVEELRKPTEILRDLSKTFQTLDEADPLRAEILTNVGGKYQAKCCLYVQKCA